MSEMPNLCETPPENRPKWKASMQDCRFDYQREDYNEEGLVHWTAIDSMHTIAMSTAHDEACGEWVTVRRPDITYHNREGHWTGLITAGELNRKLREAEHKIVKIGPQDYTRDILRGAIMKLPSKTEIRLESAEAVPLWGTFQFNDESYEFMLAPRINTPETDNTPVSTLNIPYLLEASS